MFPSVWFSYPGDDQTEWREVVCRKLTDAVSTVISLPEEIIIRVANLRDGTYGSAALEFRFRNRISISSVLSAEEIPEILVHELIHLNQIHTGVLSSYLWNNHPCPTTIDKLTYEQHQQLPWELDVAARRAEVLKEALIYAMK
jgi:hypothetical protein